MQAKEKCIWHIVLGYKSEQRSKKEVRKRTGKGWRKERDEKVLVVRFPFPSWLPTSRLHDSHVIHLIHPLHPSLICKNWVGFEESPSSLFSTSRRVKNKNTRRWKYFPTFSPSNFSLSPNNFLKDVPEQLDEESVTILKRVSDRHHPASPLPLLTTSHGNCHQITVPRLPVSGAQFWL